MTLFRLGLNIQGTSPPSFDLLTKLRGIYGIECSSFLNRDELFIYIHDKHIEKLISKQEQSQLSVYYNIFGLSKENYESIEIEKDEYIKEKFNVQNPILLVTLNFSHLLLVELTNRNISNKKFANASQQSSTNKNAFEELIDYLHEINLDFIIQIFCNYKKGSLFLSGQIALFTNNKANYQLILHSIQEQIKKLLLEYKIDINKKIKFDLFRKFYLNRILNHKPIDLYSKSAVLVNNLLQIPNLEKYSITNTDQIVNDSILPLTTLEGGVPIGFKMVPGLKHPPIVRIPFEDLTSHFCCFGITSQGKSRLMYNFLTFIDKTKKNFLVIDPKGEYFEALANTENNVSYYKIGSLEFPLSINIFSVPDGLSADNHIQFIYSLLLSIMGDEVTPQMNRLLFKAIEYSINHNGNMFQFLSLLEHPESLKIKGSYLEMSGSAVLNRILPLIIGPSKNCFFVKRSSLNFSELANKNVIIDLANFELVESTISRKVFVNTFLHYLIHTIRNKNKSIRNLGDISNFIIIEEIQKIAPLTFKGRNEINSFIGLAPWTVRAYGISMGFVGTDPNVETPIITNTGLNMIFYTKSNLEHMLKLFGIPLSEYSKYLLELKERKKFLLSYKGNLTLVKSFDFQIPDGSSIKNRYDILINSEY